MLKLILLIAAAAASEAPAQIPDPAPAAGAPAFQPRALRAEPAVRRNALIQITYEKGSLSIRSQARALNSGDVGERILVMNTQSHNTFAAEISGRNQAVVR